MSPAFVAVTAHVVPALPVAVNVVPDTEQPPVAAYVVAPEPVPPDDVSVRVDPKVIVEADVIVTVAWSAFVIVPHRKPILSMMEPTYASMPTATMPVGH